MIPTTGSGNRSADIAAAIRRVQRTAGLAATEAISDIVPLYDIVCAYPLRVAELSNLTYRKAADFLIAETGQQVPVPQEDDCRLAGFLYVYEFAGVFYGCILVKRDDPVVRRRFTIAHELGHYVLHFLPALERTIEGNNTDFVVMTEGLTYSENNATDDEIAVGRVVFTRSAGSSTKGLVVDVRQMELEANQFAAELLMPSDACAKRVNQYAERFGNNRQALAKRIASDFLVSQAAMQRRLAALGLPKSSLNAG